ncbi:MAG: hypothetical protein V1861_04855 [Candidatus Micrarchaeota archaeon]
MDDIEKIRLEIPRLYMAVIADARPEKRQEALEILRVSGDREVAKLLTIGPQVFRIINNEEDPAVLENALTTFGLLATTDTGSSFARITGQVLLGKALNMQEGHRRSEIIRYGLMILGIAQNVGIPLSKSTIQLIEKAKQLDEKHAGLAESILKQNAALMPRDMGTIFPGPKEPTGRSDERKPRGRRPH